MRQKLNAAKGDKPKGAAKGAGRGSPRMPLKLIGMGSRDDSGANLCYGFNLKACRDAQPGKACKKGLHVCGGCFKSDHAFVDYPSANR